MIYSLSNWTGGRWTTLPSVAITGFCFDSRKVREGDMFVALKSERADGHAYVERAIASGAAGAIVEEASLVAREHSELPLLVVEDSLKAFRMAARGWRRRVAPFVVGVTGSVGKSTTKEWIAALLGDYGKTASTIANFNNEIGLPYSILSMGEDTRFGVFEAGISHPNDMAPLAETMEPNAAIITAIAPVHIEYFDSLKGIASEKAGLLRALPENGFAVLDSRGEFFDYLSSQAKCRIVGACVIEKGEEPPARSDYVAEVIDDAIGAFWISGLGLDAPVRVVLGRPGRHNILDAILASAVSHECNVPWDKIVARLGNLPSMDLRWQRFDADGLHWICDCYNASPTSMAASLRAFALAVPPSKTTARAFVLGDMFELGENAVEYHKEVAKVLGEIETHKSDTLICVGKLAVNYASEKFNGSIIYAEDALDAARLLHREVPKGATVLLKASHGMHLELVPKRYHMPFSELDVDNPRVIILGGGRSGSGAQALLTRLGIASDLLNDNAPFSEGVNYNLAIASPGVPRSHAWFEECEKRKIPVVSELEFASRFWHGYVLAVTGSKGKSSVVKLCQDALTKNGQRAIACGNYGLPLSEVVIADNDIARWAVVEASSFQLEGVSSFRPDIAILLNLQADHLDRHGSMEIYARAKAALFNRFKAVGDLALLHLPAWELVKSWNHPAIERLRECEERVVEDEIIIFGVGAKQAIGRMPCERGYFNSATLAPALEAAVIALSRAGLSDDEIACAVRSFEPLPHRMERVGERDGVVFIDNSKATSLAALAAALEMANRPSRLIAGGRLKETNLSSIKFLLPKYTKKVYLIGEASQQLFDAWHDIVPCEMCENIDNAVVKAFQDATKGEAILLAPGCASFDQFKSYEERGERFALVCSSLIQKR